VNTWIFFDRGECLERLKINDLSESLGHIRSQTRVQIQGRLETSRKAGFCRILGLVSSESWTSRLRIGPHGLTMTRRRETGRRGEGETRRRGDAENFLSHPVSVSPRRCLHLAVAALTGCFGFSILLTQNGFARKLDLVALAADAFHENLLAFLQFIPNVFHTTIRNL
jgi:hypothetical protein